MKDDTPGFLSDTEREAIERAVREAEKTTSGEIVPMVVPESYTYPRAALLGALTISLVIGLASTLVLKNESLRLFLLIFIPCLLLLNYLIARVKPVKRLFITGREMDEEVAEAAVASFYNNGLYKTRDETGILIYISIFEKRIWILADRGINEKVEQSEWDETVRIIREGIKSGRQGEAIVTAVKKAGEILTRHFPARRDDRDELSNLIMKD